MSSLKVENLTAGYGRMVAVRDISFTAEPGEVTAIFGHNGAGKTTVLKSVAGVLPGARGDIRIDDRPVRGRDRGLAMVAQGSSVFPRLTVAENIRLGLVAGGRVSKSEAKERIDRAQGYLPALVPRWHHRAGDLSGGQRQMVSIARALVTGASLLLLDEPSVGLAPKLVEDMMDVFAGLRSSGMAVVLVEQNVQQALRIADRAVVLRSGSVILSGTADELRDRDTLWELF
jgi:branched-chain amino acid transport system ATP-binding protein